jgi:3-oxoadipate enol-lactonase
MSGGPTYEERGQGPPLVFLHGIGGDAACWQPQREAFSEGHRAIAWNMPGYAGSPALPEMTFPALAEALLRLLDRLHIERAHLVGHSMGGMVAQEFAASWPGRLRSLVLVATSAALGPAAGDWQRDFLASRLGPLERGRSMADLAPGIVARLVGEAPDPAGVEQAIASMSRVPEATYRAALRCLLSFDRRDALARIEVPTLLLAGERDQTAPAAVMEKMAARIPHARFLALPRAGHLANLEQPTAFNRELSAFLQAPGGGERQEWQR